jgi:hypothetical protein
MRSRQLVKLNKKLDSLYKKLEKQDAKLFELTGLHMENYSLKNTRHLPHKKRVEADKLVAKICETSDKIVNNYYTIDDIENEKN